MGSRLLLIARVVLLIAAALSRAACASRPLNEEDRVPARSRSAAVAGHSGSDALCAGPTYAPLPNCSRAPDGSRASSIRVAPSCAASVRSRAQCCSAAAAPSGVGGAAGSRIRSRARRSSRRWYRPAIEPLPAEPGGWWSCALLGRARRARGCSTPGDDRLETRAYAVKRYLFRLGHAQRSARLRDVDRAAGGGVGAGDGLGPGPARRVPSGRGSCARIGAACSAGWTTCRPPAWSCTSPSATRTGCGGARRSCCCAAPAPIATSSRSRRGVRAGGARASGLAAVGRVAPEPGRDPGAQRRPVRADAGRVALGRRLRRARARRRAAVEARIAARCV